MSTDVKLTPRENKTIIALKNGAVLLTDSSVAGAWVCGYGKDFKIGNKVFWNLVEKRKIQQMLGYPFDYVLFEKAGILYKGRK